MSDETVPRKNWNIAADVRRWNRSEDYEAGKAPDSHDHYPGNLLMNAGITRMLDLLIGAGGTAFNATNCRLGVGDSTTAESAAQTDLQAATNKQWKLVSSVTRSAATTITIVAAFGSAQANFAWQEWAIDNGTADGTTVTAPMLNRKVVSMGTKGSGSTWTLTVTLTIA